MPRWHRGASSKVFLLPPTNAIALPSVSSIYSLARSLLALPPTNPIKQRFTQMFEVKAKDASLVIPPEFEAKVREMFSAYPEGTTNLRFVTNQTVITTYNRYTEEYSMFNEVRRYRPGYQERLSPDNEHVIQQAISESEGADKCDFCSEVRTAVDVFGRIESKHCYTASNVAKYEQWHGLIVAKTHHPLLFDQDALQDYVETAHEWYRRVNKIDPRAQYPHLMWDAGKRASASQIHQHLQMIITQERYLTRTEHSRAAGFRYESDTGVNYWQDLVAIHEQLGLVVRSGGTTAIVSYVTPIKERELIIVTENSHDPSFARAIATVLHVLVDDLGCRAFSLAINFAPLDERGNTIGSAFPAMARVVDRGSPMDTRSDVGAMEFYGANNVGADPYQIIPVLQRHVASEQHS